MGDLTGAADRTRPVKNHSPSTIVLTGASSGIGLAAAKELAGRGHHVVLVGRDPQRLAAAVESVRLTAGGRKPDAHRADFAVLDEVRALGKRLADTYPKIDVLVNNAGLLSHHRSITIDGWETTIQVNHLSGFLLSHLLIDNLPAGGKLITTASVLERIGAVDPDDLSGSRHAYSRWHAYGSSKQANVLFTAEAAQRWAARGVVATCFHPGSVSTRFGRGSRLFEYGIKLPLFISPEAGADTLVWLAENPGAETGGYYRKRKIRKPSSGSRDLRLARLLWQRSAEALGLGSDL